MEFEPVIGLEIHAQLKTNTKIFCGCSTSFGALPNENTCPVCLGLPGALPVLNKKVVEYAVRAAIATHCTVAKYSRFARKNYFYPDLPLGYQISQFELPLCEHGYLDIDINHGEKTKRIGITRIHLENDAGKSSHDPDRPVSYVDLNRAGTPLIEIVSEPDLRSAEEAGAFLRQMHSIVRYLDICDGNMEQGSFRCDANISVRPVGQEKFGTRTELKNLNSFRNVEKAIRFESNRQISVIEDGGTIIQETRLFEPSKKRTSSMRFKEDAQDYRYFPDPDLLPLIIDNEWLGSIQKTIPELAEEKKARFINDYQLPADDTKVLVSSKELADYFESGIKEFSNPRQICNWVTGPLLGFLNVLGINIQESPVSPKNLADLVKLIEEDVISGKIAKIVFKEMAASGKSPIQIVEEKDLVQISDIPEINRIITGILDTHSDEVEQYKKKGQKKLMGFFMGQVMKITKGKVNPKIVNQILRDKLD